MTFRKSFAIIEFVYKKRGVAQLVARSVRDSITVLCVVNSKNAENP